MCDPVLRTSPCAIKPLVPLILAMGLLSWQSSTGLAQQQGKRIAPAPFIVHLTDAAGKNIPGVLVKLGGRYIATSLSGQAIFDGLPAGNYKLDILHSGWNRLQREVQVSQGRRDMLKLTLNRETLLNLKGKVVAEGSSQPVENIDMLLTPLDVAAGVQGPVYTSTGIDGSFVLTDLPAGTYRCRITAPGYAERDFPLKLAEDKQPITLVLQPVWTAHDLSVTVTDRATGKPLPGARVILAEAVPKGVVATADTAANGQALLSKIPVGLCNEVGQDDRLVVCRARLAVRVEAKGYATGLATVDLDHTRRISIALDPAGTLAQTEGNEQLSGARRLPFGSKAELTVDAPKRSRYFRFDLEHKAIVTARLEKALDHAMRVEIIDASGKQYAGTWAYANHSPTATVSLDPGRYFIRISATSDRVSTDKTMTLSLDRSLTADPFEPNDTPGGAALLLPGQTVRGYITANKDIDVFRVEVPRAGWGRFHCPAQKFEPHLELYNANGERLEDRWNYTGQPVNLDFNFPAAGTYFLHVHEAGMNNRSADPYDVRFYFVGNDHEALGGGRMLRSIEPDSLIAGNIAPQGEQDRYLISLPSAGRLTLRARGPLEPQLTLFDLEGKKLVSGWNYTNQPVLIGWDVQGPTSLVLAVNEAGNNNWSPSPYVCRATFEPCDEYERTGRNDTPASATPLELTEVIRGNISPLKDVDYYRFVVDHPGYVTVEGIEGVELQLTAYDSRGNELETKWNYLNQPVKLVFEAHPGEYLLKVNEAGSNNWSVHPYRIRVLLHRAEPYESTPLDREKRRALLLNQARSMAFEHISDTDRFAFSAAQAGTYHLRAWSPNEVKYTIHDARTGEKVADPWFYSGHSHVVLKCEGPTTYHIDVHEASRNARSNQPGFLMVSQDDKLPIQATDFEVSADPVHPTRVTFKTRPIPTGKGLTKIEIDANGDGKYETAMPGQSVVVDYASEGLYVARLRMTGDSGQTALLETWVAAIGPRERKGVLVHITQPAQDQIIQRDIPCRVGAISYEAADIRSVTLLVDGREIARAYRRPFEMDIPWRDLGPGQHEILALALDARGNQGRSKRTVTLSPFFDLQPEDAAMLSGNTVGVRWFSSEFSPPRLRYRKVGQEGWNQALGQAGREKIILLEDLDPGEQYEIQPIGPKGPGPLRRITRVKGLAFGRPRYGATIQRNYDQRMGITVRNHGDKAMTVELEADQPEDSKLLVAFVSAGEPKTSFTLEPGRQRQFTLGFSAQDVVKPLHMFDIRIRSDSGYADQAQVEVRVQLPEVKFSWEPIEEERKDMTRRFRLRNQGDTITDLSISSEDDVLIVDPQMQHGMVKRGQSIEVSVTPKFHAGWKGCKTQLVASAFGKSFNQPVEIHLPEGEQMYKIPLLPGYDPLEGESSEQEDILAARALAGAWLDPDPIDWSKRRNPQDTDGDMQPDRWEFPDELNNVQWLGDDTNGDGEVDFVHADLGGDGQFEYSAFRTEQGWEETNLVDAWLEMNFSVPKHRSRYEPHDIDLVLNDRVVARIKQSIPEGNYSFRLPPSALRWTQAGTPGENKLEIRSHFMNYAHYAITSDFQFKARLTSGSAWMPGVTLEDAYGRLLESNTGLTVSGADYSVSSASVKLDAPEKLKKGDPVVVRAELRNLGAAAEEDVAVALFRAVPGTEGVELARTFVSPGKLTRPVPVALRWDAAAGVHSLRIVVDPDEKTSDTNRRNNTAIHNLTVPGDDSPPKLEVLSPAEGSTLESPLVNLKVKTEDDGGVSRVEVQIDDGLFVPLLRAGQGASGRAVLQPGGHRLTFRALDGAGNRVEKAVKVDVKAEAPTVRIDAPAPGARLESRSIRAEISVSEGVELAAVRVAGQPWQPVVLDSNKGIADLDLPFGPCRIEAVALDARALRGLAQVEATCTVQPAQDEAPTAADTATPLWAPSDIGPGTTFDPFGSADQVFVPLAEQATEAETLDAPAGVQIRLPFIPSARDGQTVYFLAPIGAAISRSGRVAGGISVHRHHKDWYCPNRPKISTRFKLPDWLRKLDLSKYPPDSEEYRRLEKKLLDHLRRRGIDTSKLEKFRDLLLSRAGRLEQAGPLPDFWQSLGFKAMPPDDPEARKAWREKMRKNTQMFWLRLLASGDPSLIAKGLSARADAMGKFDQALQEHAQAAIETVNASQQLAEDVVESSLAVAGVFFPPAAVAGELLDVYAALAGRTMLADRKVGAFERFLRGAGSIGVRGMEQAYKRSAAVRRAADGLYRFSAAAGEVGTDFMKRTFPRASELTGSAVDTVTQVLTKQRRLDFWRAGKAAQQAGEVFESTAKGIDAARRMARDEGTAKALLQRFQDASDPDAIRQLARQGQSNKTFQRIINEVADDATKVKFNTTVKGWYDQADKITGARLQQVLKQGDDVKFNRIAQQLGVEPGQLRKLRDQVNQSVQRNREALERMGVQVDNVTVEPMFITRPRRGVKVGRDRDVTYFVYANAPDGTKIMVGEIHHDLSRRIYQQEFYRAAMNADDVPRLANGLPDHKAVDHFNTNMDQAVTSSMDLEAYNVGEVELSRFFNQGNDPSTITRIEDLRDTMKHKSNEWFERAAHASDPIQQSRNMVEGMRQSHKQFDDMVIARIKQYGLDPKVAVPGKLQVGMDVFRQAGSGKISAEKAAAMLAANGLSPQKVSDMAADFFEGVEKTAGNAFRAAGTATLTKNLDQLRNAGRADWADQSIRTINSSLGKGKISGATFREARNKVFSDLREQLLAQPDGTARWSRWVQNAYQQGLINLKEAGRLR